MLGLGAGLRHAGVCAPCAVGAENCSHLLDVVETTAHRIAVLDHGKLLACGTAAELRTQVGAGAGVHLDMVFRTLVKASDPIAVAKAILG